MTKIRQERRTATRAPKAIEAVIRPRRAPRKVSGNALIEELSVDGLRVRSERPLKIDDSVLLSIDNDPVLMRAKVIWARREGLIETRLMGKPGQAYVAGCRLRDDLPPTEKAATGSAKEADRWTTIFIRSMRVGFYLALAGITGMVGFALYKLISLVS